MVSSLWRASPVRGKPSALRQAQGDWVGEPFMVSPLWRTSPVRGGPAALRHAQGEWIREPFMVKPVRGEREAVEPRC